MPERHILAPAKLNLHLEILGRDPGGFHILETVFQALDLADELLVATAPGHGTVLSISDTPHARGLGSGPDNLAVRAVEAYRRLRPDLGRVSLELTKHIPPGGGLGGGSSDAAAVLRALADLDPAPPTDAELLETAAGLGSDVAFFLHGGRAWATGRGERLQPLAPLPPHPCWLVLPPCACATARVYAALDDAERGPRRATGPAAFAGLGRDGRPGGNRLTGACRRSHPAMAPWLDWAAASGIPWLLCGSGSSIACFAEPPPPPPGATLIATRFRP